MTRSAELYAKAQQYIPGGVNSPVRAFRGVGGTPVFMTRAEGAYIYDADGQRYIDYIGSWGPMIAGHAHPQVVQAVQQAAERGLSFGCPTGAETELAERICRLFPSIERVRLTSSGTEATMSAIRLARGYTGRDRILKFEGCYHGHSDSLLVKAGSGALTLGVPTSPGVPADLARHTMTASYNDLEQVHEIFAAVGNEIAAIIVEPIAGNMNCVLPLPGFLEGLRELATRFGAVLIFDEVMTGFRVAPGGAQALYNLTPDITTLGKVIGGGMPVGAFGGRAAIMAHIAPEGPIYQAGTLSGNPVAMAAGIATLDLLATPGFHSTLEARTRALTAALEAEARAAGIPFTTVTVCGMFGLYFTEASTISSFADVMACEVERFKRFFHAMLAAGVYLAPSAFEAGFISAAHTEQEIEATRVAARAAFASCA